MYCYIGSDHPLEKNNKTYNINCDCFTHCTRFSATKKKPTIQWLSDITTGLHKFIGQNSVTEIIFFLKTKKKILKHKLHMEVSKVIKSFSTNYMQLLMMYNYQ